ncbi:hypothetical protein IW152_001361 [Coemansia sp. BCRC 34962]|nr:hypothetical protein IW152_001361 [Coemansia sp. BCRC 34962]
MVLILSLALSTLSLGLTLALHRSSLPTSPPILQSILENDKLSTTGAFSEEFANVEFATKQVEISAASKDILAMYAAYSGAAYTVSTKWDCPYACEHPGTEGTVVEYNWEIGVPESAGYIARNPDKKLIIVAFRGTDNILQWVDNTDVWQMQWPAALNNSYVHRGFLRGYLSVQAIVLNYVKEIATEYPDYSISLAGHSLGGAKAAICLLDLSLTMPELLPRLRLYTQGQPRVGNRGFANAINALGVLISREVYEYDLIPRLPLASMGYRHYNFEVWDHANTTKVCLDPSPLDHCADVDGLFYPSAVDDHVSYRGLKYE